MLLVLLRAIVAGAESAISGSSTWSSLSWQCTRVIGQFVIMHPNVLQKLEPPETTLRDTLKVGSIAVQQKLEIGVDRKCKPSR